MRTMVYHLNYYIRITLGLVMFLVYLPKRRFIEIPVTIIAETNSETFRYTHRKYAIQKNNRKYEKLTLIFVPGIRNGNYVLPSLIQHGYRDASYDV